MKKKKMKITKANRSVVVAVEETTITARETTTLGEFLTSIANDDILHEIFTRLPNFRILCHCAAVCRRWRSVISNPSFAAIFKRHRRSPPFTLLFTYLDYPIFSDDSKILHGAERSAACINRSIRYVSFLPEDSGNVLKSSYKDLLLVQLSPPQYLCVCNPLTRRWLSLPQIPGFRLKHSSSYTHALVSDPGSDHNFRVAAIRMRSSGLQVSVFCSETWQWDTSYVTRPMPPELRYYPRTVGTSDGIVYMPLAANIVNLKKIMAFDLWSDVGWEVSLPAGLRVRRRGYHSECVGLGGVRGRLRLWQSYFDKRMDNKFVVKAWQLNRKNGKYDWENVHVLRMASGGESELGRYCVVVGFHPGEEGVLFYCNRGSEDRSLDTIWQCHIKTGKCQQIGEAHRSQYTRLVYVLEHPSCPTAIRRLLKRFEIIMLCCIK